MLHKLGRSKILLNLEFLAFCKSRTGQLLVAVEQLPGEHGTALFLIDHTESRQKACSGRAHRHTIARSVLERVLKRYNNVGIFPCSDMFCSVGRVKYFQVFVFVRRETGQHGQQRADAEHQVQLVPSSWAP